MVAPRRYVLPRVTRDFPFATLRTSLRSASVARDAEFGNRATRGIGAPSSLRSSGHSIRQPLDKLGTLKFSGSPSLRSGHSKLQPRFAWAILVLRGRESNPLSWLMRPTRYQPAPRDEKAPPGCLDTIAEKSGLFKRNYSCIICISLRNVS